MSVVVDNDQERTKSEVVAASNLRLDRGDLIRSQNFIAGEWQSAATGALLPVGINEGALAVEAAPFGGVEESGYGREGSRYGLEHYMHIKYLCQGQLS